MSVNSIDADAASSHVVCLVGLCQQQHKKLLVVVQQAWDLGTLTVTD